MDMYEDVRVWHRMFDIPVAECLTEPDSDRLELRQSLHNEELGELHRSMECGDFVGVADGIADLIWVLCGTAAEYGIPLNRVWMEVKRSNFAKLGPDGRPIYRSDGKVMKPDGWTPPDIEGVLNAVG